MKLRPYQQAAIEAVYDHLRQHDDNPCVVIPTGGGKTPVLATIVRDAVERWDGRVLVLAHVKELLSQAADKLQAICPGIPVGIYSAGLHRRDTSQACIVAGIQSVHRRACELGAFNLILVDEAHLIPTNGEGMYRQFLKDAQIVNPKLRVIGLTATPYRMTSGVICASSNILNSVCYEVGVKELIRDGYLCDVVAKRGKTRASFQGLHVRGGEYVSQELSDRMDTDALVDAACREIVDLTRDRNKCLLFASSIKHAEHIKSVLTKRHGQRCAIVTGNTPAMHRDAILTEFKQDKPPVDLFGNAEPPLKYLVNVAVLTTGFDAPNIDCVALMRATLSPGLYYQMVGRGFRLHPSKTNCLILDYGDNVQRHGPIDKIIADGGEGRGRRDASESEAVTKVCPKCDSIIHAGYGTCPDCGHEFPPPESSARHNATAGTQSIVSEESAIEEHEVRDVHYSVHIKRGARDDDDPKTLRVDYWISLNDRVSEWVCVEHDGWAGKRAAEWWAERSNDPFPASSQHAVDIANAHGVAITEAITVKRTEGNKFPEIVGHEVGEVPEACGVEESTVVGELVGEMDIPF